MFGRKPKEEKKAETKPAAKAAPHADLGRNDPCHCGSGKKYKKCCMSKDEVSERNVLEAQWAKSAAAAAKEQTETKEKEKDTPNVPSKPTGPQKSAKQQHPTFVPHQVAMPRKSGGGA